jgi:hypothetical protein
VIVTLCAWAKTAPLVPSRPMAQSRTADGSRRRYCLTLLIYRLPLYWNRARQTLARRRHAPHRKDRLTALYTHIETRERTSQTAFIVLVAGVPRLQLLRPDRSRETPYVK